MRIFFFLLIACFLILSCSRNNQFELLIEKADDLFSHNIDSSKYYLEKSKDFLNQNNFEHYYSYNSLLAKVYLKERDFITSDSIIRNLKSSIDQSEKRALFFKINLEIELAKIEFEKQEFKKSIKILEKIKDFINLLKKDDYDKTSIKYNELYAILLVYNGKIEKAYEMFKSIYEYRKSNLIDTLTSFERYIAALNNLALCKEYLNDTVGSLNLYYEALRLLDEHNWMGGEDEIVLKNNLCRLYLYNGDNERVIEIVNEIILKDNYPSHNFESLLYLAHANAANQSYEEAKKLYLQALPKAKYLNRKMDQLLIKTNIGLMNIKLNQTNSGISILRESEKKLIENNFKDELCKTYSALGEAYLKVNDKKNAIKYLMLAEEEFKNSKKTRNRHSFNQNFISLYYESEKRYKESLNWIKKSNLSSIDYINERKAFQIRELEIKYQIQEKENQILKLTNENIQKENSLAKSRIVIISVFCMFLLITLFSFTLFQRRKQQHKLALLETKLKSEEEERGKIGRELHDGIGSTIKRIANNSDNIGLETSHKLLETYDQVRLLSHQLNNTAMQDEIFFDRVQEILPINKGGKIFNFTISPKTLKLSEPLGTHVFRVFQELITNNSKHSKATFTQIDLTLEDTSLLILKYKDNGVGAENLNKGIGLSNIDFRVKLLKGKLKYKTKKGFSLNITIPYKINS